MAQAFQVVSGGWIVTGSGPGCALVAERAGELAAEPVVLIGERLVALEGCGEPAAQGGVGRLLAGRDGAGRVALGSCAAELADLVADVGLGVEQGPRYAGCRRAGAKGDGCAGA